MISAHPGGQVTDKDTARCDVGSREACDGAFFPAYPNHHVGHVGAEIRPLDSESGAESGGTERGDGVDDRSVDGEKIRDTLPGNSDDYDSAT
jgi:hypothetical protein